MNSKNLIYLLSGLALCLASPVFSVTQNPVSSAAEGGISETSTDADIRIIPPLFEYPVAPEDIQGLQAKTDYLMRNFWNAFNFNQKKTVDQIALNDAFATYCAFIPHADKNVVLKSFDDLIKKLRKNPVLMYQFMRTAEENLYGQRASMWVDEIYLKFLNALIDNKKIDKSRKARYEDQRARILTSIQGSVLPSFRYSTPDGNSADYKPAGKVSIIEFGNPDCDDCRKSKIVMELDMSLRELVENKTVSVAFINVEETDLPLSVLFSSYSSDWTLGSNPELMDVLDIRNYPSFFVLDSEGKIVGKNLNVVQALDLTKSLAEKQ